MIQREAARVAGMLTKAQRACLMAMQPPATITTAMQGEVKSTRWARAAEIGARGSTLASLNGLGGVDPNTLLCGPILVTPDYGPTGTYWALTDAGLAVRQHLLQEKGK